MYTRWQEYVRLETEHGERLSIYTDVDRMEAELLKRAPEAPSSPERLYAPRSVAEG